MLAGDLLVVMVAVAVAVYIGLKGFALIELKCLFDNEDVEDILVESPFANDGCNSGWIFFLVWCFGEFLGEFLGEFCVWNDVVISWIRRRTNPGLDSMLVWLTPLQKFNKRIFSKIVNKQCFPADIGIVYYIVFVYCVLPLSWYQW